LPYDSYQERGRGRCRPSGIFREVSYPSIYLVINQMLIANNKSSPLNGVAVMPAPPNWGKPCVHTELSLHQLSPYIGKIKSSIAADLIEKYSKPGDIVVDPFAGAGTIPLEASIRGRVALGADISPYARILTTAKMFPPRSLGAALDLAEEALTRAAKLPSPDLSRVPIWVRGFFHPRTLSEALNFAIVCRRPGNEFLMACLLGILHHQRPGFLSYPSSHLVPYLRTRKFPRRAFPQMYAYRELRPRLLAKVKRSYRRFYYPAKSMVLPFQHTDVMSFSMPSRIGAIITSPPYMNALDYCRDNRLRLWFIDSKLADKREEDATRRPQAFVDCISSLAQKVEESLRPKGYCIYVVGDELRRSFAAHPSEVVASIMRDRARSLQ